MGTASHLETNAWKPCPLQKIGTRASDVLKLAYINMALKTWLKLGNIHDLAVKCGRIKKEII